MSVGYNPRIVTNGLIMYFDAANPASYPSLTGTSSYDLTGNGNNGTFFGSLTGSRANLGCLDFTGTGTDYVTFTEASPEMTSSNFTIECACLIKSDINIRFGTAPTSIQYIMCRQNVRTAQFEGYAFYYDETVPGFIFLTTPASGVQNLMTSNAISLNKVYHACITVGPVTEYMYINGEYHAQVATPVISYHPTNRPHLGRFLPTGATFDAAFNGQIYFCRYYNRALSKNEVIQNYNATKTRFNL